MSAKPPSNIGHLNKLIDELSRDATSPQATAGRLRRLVAVTAFAEILASVAPSVAFKGGVTMEFRFGVAARGSRDVDALTDVDLSETFDAIAARLEDGWCGFTGHLTDRTEITRPKVHPPPQRCKVKLHYKGKPFITLNFELSRATGSLVDLTEQIPNSIELDPVRLAADGDVTILNVHYQIAQKLHACSEVLDEGSNQRVHDLYDILLLAGIAADDGLNRTRDACVNTFAERGKQPWPPTVTSWPDWPRLWEALAIDEADRFPYDEALARTEQFIDEIHSAG